MSKSKRRLAGSYKSRGKRPYDYSHLFRDVPENARALRVFLWTAELAREPSYDALS